ncbi:MAG TPA: DMT family transporter [Dongiaceae bacterium]|nr:DMT family transporter [Dongiaceae bacterium]
MAAPARMTPLDWSLLLTLSILWGGSFFFVGVVVKAIPPFTLALVRVAIAATALHILLRAMRSPMPRDARTWLAFFGMGLLNNAIPFSLIAWSQTHIASGLASILNATTPLFTVLVAHVLTADERLSKGRIVGVLLGLAGVVALIGPQALVGLSKDVLAQFAVLGAAISYAFASIFGRRFKRLGVPPLATAAGQVTASSALLLPVALIVDRPWTLPPPGLPVWGAILGLALLATALAYILFFRILASAGAVNLMLVTFLIPVSAILLGSAFLDEALAPMDFVGMALIGLGLAAIDGRLAALLPHLRARASQR